MNLCNNKLFSLPEMNIIGGDYKECMIFVNDLDNGGYMDLENLKIDFAIVPYIDRNGAPILAKSNDSNPVDVKIAPENPDAFLLIIRPEDTINLSGRYIYQISIHAPKDTKQESFQGILTIDKNINPHAFM